MAAAAAAAGTAAAAAAGGSGMFAAGFDFSQFQQQQQQQMFASMASMPYMMPGMYGMPAPPMAAATGGFGGAAGSQGFEPGAYDPLAAAQKRAAWQESRLLRQQPAKRSRLHKPHRCNYCWNALAKTSKQHKNGEGDWDKGLRCPFPCASCQRPMEEHVDKPCSEPVRNEPVQS
jgi:hypothetical protein